MMNIPFTKGNAKYDILSCIAVNGYERFIIEKIVVFVRNLCTKIDLYGVYNKLIIHINEFEV